MGITGSKKIIIVEDDTITKFFMVVVLTRIGHEVIASVTSSNKLFDLINDNKPDVVLMDIGIGGVLDGIQASKILIQEYKLPVIFVTGRSDLETLNKARSTGALGIIYKPINDDDLRVQLGTLLRKLQADRNKSSRINNQ